MTDGQAGSTFMAHFRRIEADWNHQEREWLAAMIEAYNPALIHPDDGWVDGKANTIHPCYPQHKRTVKAGDTIILGHHDKWRAVRCTEIITPQLRARDTDRTYKFEEPTP